MFSGYITLAAEMIESAPFADMQFCWSLNSLLIGSGFVLMRNMRVGRDFPFLGYPYFPFLFSHILDAEQQSNC